MLRRAMAAVPSTCGGRAPPAVAALADADATQLALMAERVIAVDREDRVLRGLSKAAAHQTATGLPLHRAFSVFLFDTGGRLLVQQRSPAKVTYPARWANACCSHPLWTPTERGEPDAAELAEVAAENAAAEAAEAASAAARAEAVKAASAAAAAARSAGEAGAAVIRTLFEGVSGDGSVMRSGRVARVDPVRGVKRAALRKLGHELGVAPDALATGDLHMLGRFHYRDVMAGGVWGEHEMDYVLVAEVPAGIALAPNENEVAATRWVTNEELREMFRAARAEREDGGPEPPVVSPWFEAIMDSRGWTWWQQLEHNGLTAVLALQEDGIIELGECEGGRCATEFVATKECGD